MFELDVYLDSKREQVNAYLDQCLRDTSGSSRLVAAMRYSLMAGGKRLRPLLCLAGAEAVGGQPDDFISTACALEMIHTYSLIHDDLPAMDNDSLRRGKPTCHMAFNEATAILAGDALLTMAFQTLSSVEHVDNHRALKWLGVINRISRAVGYQGMIEGQMRDIDAESAFLSQDALEKLHQLKTGALIEASVYCGAFLGGANQVQLDRLQTYAECIGLAFQVKDDVLNVVGDPEMLGKKVGTDAVRKKSTYPSIIGLEESKSFARHLVKRAIQALESFDQRSVPLRAMAEYIIERQR